MFYTVNLTISIGDIINFLILISGIVAVYIQNRALKVSEKELHAKMTDLETVVKELDQERKDRTRQIDERKEEDLRLLNYTSSVVATEQENRRKMEEMFYNHFSTLNLSAVVISKTLHSFIVQFHKAVAKMDDEQIAETLPVLNVLERIAQANTLDNKSYEVSKQFNQDTREASKKFEATRNQITATIPYSKKFEEELEKAKRQFDIDLAFAVKRHNDASAELGVDYTKIDSELSNAIKKILSL
ncbi:MAG: hypothetical protein RL660_1698 [Bacteroidota bacterium]|jgi:hypothetical protein